MMRDDRGAMRFVQTQRGFGYVVAGVTGTMAAALAANSVVWGIRANTTNKAKLTIGSLRLSFTTAVAFTTPLTLGRELAVYRGAGASLTGGTAITPVLTDSANAGPDANPILDARIAATAALGVAAFVREANPLDQLTLAEVGAAGAIKERTIEYHPAWKHPIVLNPGELVVISNPAAMDAAGTWQLAVDCTLNVAEAL